MDLFSYDHAEIAQRIQQRLDRLSVNFLRRHGARIHRDDLDFHGHEHIDLEVEHEGHRLVIHQAGLAEGLGEPADGPADIEVNVFESTFDDRPASQIPLNMLESWLAQLPVGEAVPDQEAVEFDPENPFVAESSPTVEAREANPFMAERSAAPSDNPFAPDPEAERKRRALLNWLSEDDEKKS